MRRVTLLFSLLLACGPAKPDVEVDGWALARAALVDGESCYAKRPEYCLRDPELIDASIQAALDARYAGQMPKRSREVDKVIRSARIDYYDASKQPERLVEISALVDAHYLDPKLDASDPKLVAVDLGALPGRLVVQGRVPEIVLADSPLIDQFKWQGHEAGRVLAKYAAAYPDKPVIRVELLIPKGSGTKPLVYRYFRAEQRVAFGELLDDSIYMTKPLVGGVEALEGLDLRRESLEFCSRPHHDSESSAAWCPWRDEYGEAAQRARRERARER